MPLDERKRNQSDELRARNQDAGCDPLTEPLEAMNVDRSDRAAQESHQG